MLLAQSSIILNDLHTFIIFIQMTSILNEAVGGGGWTCSFREKPSVLRRMYHRRQLTHHGSCGQNIVEVILVGYIY